MRVPRESPHVWRPWFIDRLRMRRKRKRRGSDHTRDGSERTHDGSERNRDGSERTRGQDSGSAAGDGDEEWDLAANYMEPSEGWWNRYGFKSLGEYFRYSENGPDRPFSFAPARRKKDLPAPDLPDGGAPRRRSLARTRQISIRLDEDSYQDLLKASRMYGVAPATMGRLLVAKGARKATEGG